MTDQDHTSLKTRQEKKKKKKASNNSEWTVKTKLTSLTFVSPERKCSLCLTGMDTRWIQKTNKQKQTNQKPKKKTPQKTATFGLVKS